VVEDDSLLSNVEVDDPNGEDTFLSITGSPEHGEARVAEGTTAIIARPSSDMSTEVPPETLQTAQAVPLKCCERKPQMRDHSTPHRRGSPSS